MDGSDSEGDQDEIVPDQDEFREEDIELVDLEGHPEEEEIEDNVDMPSSPHHDGENRDSDEEGNVSRTSRRRSSRRVLDSDEEGTVEQELTIEYDYDMNEELH